jgi:gluconokinase
MTIDTERTTASFLSAAGNDPPAVVVMGVSGAGKSVIGEALAAAIGARFIEGDQLQPEENVARMAAGLPLTDELRAGWLARVGTEIAASRAAGVPAIAACSALKRAYRDRLRALNPALVFIHLELDPETARARVATRKGHFMPASLVDSQFATLERPGLDELAFSLSALRPAEELVATAASFIRNSMAKRGGKQSAP